MGDCNKSGEVQAENENRTERSNRWVTQSSTIDLGLEK